MHKNVIFVIIDSPKDSMQNNYYKLLDTLPLASIVIDKDCKIMHVNSIGIKSLDASLSELKKLSISVFYPEINCCVSNEGNNYETIFIDKKGNKKNVVLKFATFNEGDLYGVVYIIQECHLIEKQKFNEIILNNIPADIAVFDENHNYLFVNKNGINNEETRKWLIGKSDFDYCDFKGLDRSLAQGRRDLFNQAIQSRQQVEWVDEFHRADKDIFVMRRFFPVIVDGEFYYMIGYGVDVTEIKKTQNAILYNENRTKQILASAHDAIIKFDSDGKITFWNPKAELYFGWKSEEVIGAILYDVIFPRTISNEYVRHINEYLNATEEFGLNEIMESIGFHRINRKFPIEMSTLPLIDENGIVTFCVFIRDISSRKQKELVVEQQNKMLHTQNSELEQFTYITSHDLQEPVLSLISFSELLFEEYADVLDDEGKLYIQFINNSATRMRALVTGLMEYARIGKREAFTAIDCNEIIKYILIDLSLRINKSKAQIEVENLPNIRGQTTYIRLLFQNLISNAMKFVKPDVQPIIKISCSETLYDWKFSVEDNGIGIEQKNIDQVFIIFKRLNNDSLYKGYGIGLAHCKKIVDLHNGEIYVKSQLNKGSTFSFTISKNLQ